MKYETIAPFPDRNEIIGIITGIIPFFYKSEQYSYALANGQIVEFQYTDIAGIGLGIVTIIIALSNLRLLSQTESDQRIWRILVFVIIFGLGAYALLRGLGILVDPVAIINSSQ